MLHELTRVALSPPSPTRLHLFVDLQRRLLMAPAEPVDVAARIVEEAVPLLGVIGAALGIAEDGRYQLLAAHALGPDYRVRYDSPALPDSPLLTALASGRPVVVPEFTADLTNVRTVIVPFKGRDVLGALHLVDSPPARLPDEELELAQALAQVAGSALSSARQCQRLAQLARVKSDALAAMAHDLRAPLNALVGYTSLMRDGTFGPLTAAQAEVVTSLERQALELIDLVTATLNVARLETGTLPLQVEEFALADVLAALLSGTFAQASRSGHIHTRVCSDLPRLRTDRVKVKEILQNLLDNALRHRGLGPVEVDVTLAADRAAVRVTVRDTGPGIAADVLPGLFQPFRPGPGHQGTGFGLYLVRCFTEALGGRVAAHSRPAEGTAVVVELPLRSSPG
jgi:signal transduction histidine kinase